MVLFCFKKKKVGKYLETIGTCLAFSDKGIFTSLPSTNTKHLACQLFTKTKIDTIFFLLAEVAAADNQTPHKTVEPVAKLHKILKFRLALDNVDGENTRSTSS